MEQYQFKTNINCGGCVTNVMPVLNDAIGEDKWQVDITDPKKILTVTAAGLSEADVIHAVNKAGYKAEKL